MSRPSVTLACIMKNEEENLPRMMESVKDCFDEIIITDTGSTDNSVEVAKKLGAEVYHFNWINDFAAARNASFDPVKTDFVMWLDLDDVLLNKEGFINWRNDVMGLADYWIATYHYASDSSGKPVCSFARERVFRRDRGMRWKYFVHEGLMPVSPFGPIKMQITNVWSVKHMRTDADLIKDRSRNLNLFANRNDLDARMLYYYGKELFEAGQTKEAVEKLKAAIARAELEMHDRILAMQYLCFAYMQLEQFDKVIEMANQGVILTPNRAEFHSLIGDCFVKMGRLHDAIPFYSAAKNCQMQSQGGIGSVIFSHEDTYTAYPRNQLARIYANAGDMDRAESEASESAEKFKSEESKLILAEVKRLKTATHAYKNAKPCDDIVISCPPHAPYLWDGEIYKQKAMGGSETAAIEMAQWLHKLSGRRVIVFNHRETSKHVDGVDYIPASQLAEYMASHKPWLHISWRHPFKVTDAPTFLWCHDLITPGAEATENYIKMLCLTPFHKRYAMGTQGIPADKIHVTRNGIRPDRFKDGSGETVNPYLSRKNPNKFVFPSSPDRGLDRAMRVLDKVRETYPDVELHVFYGIEHLHKYGLADLAARLKAMMEERPWVKYHGATQQDVLMDHLKEAAIWLHPCDFVETSCITAMEMVCAGVYPVTRRLGGLMDTLAEPERRGMATLIDSDCITEREYQLYIDATLKALNEKAWERVSMDPNEISWESVAKEWLETLPKMAYPQEVKVGTA